ncbi:hypothetical protein BGZ83_001698, partial [Gryganskiella cystojenkinii]
MIKEILVTTDCPKSALYSGMELNGQSNIFTTTSKDFHKHSRRMVSTSFELKHLRSLEPIMHENQILHDSTSVKRGNKILPQDHVNIYSLIQRLATDIFGETSFSQKFNMVKNESHELPDRFTMALKSSWRQESNPWMRWIIPRDPSIFGFVADIVRSRKVAGENGRRADALQGLIDAQTPGTCDEGNSMDKTVETPFKKSLTDKAILSEALFLLIGGSATVASPLTFTLMYLAENSDKLTLLREELDLTTASNALGDLPTHDQVRNLPYLTGCINESLRLRTSAAIGLPRDVPEDVVTKG